MHPMHAGDQVKEGGGWVGRQVIARGVELSPCHELTSQECKGENAPCEQAGFYAVHLSPARGNLRPLQCATAQDQYARVEPQQLWYGRRPPLPHFRSHGVGAEQERGQGADDREKHTPSSL